MHTVNIIKAEKLDTWFQDIIETSLNTRFKTNNSNHLLKIHNDLLNDTYKLREIIEETNLRNLSYIHDGVYDLKVENNVKKILTGFNEKTISFNEENYKFVMLRIPIYPDNMCFWGNGKQEQSYEQEQDKNYYKSLAKSTKDEIVKILRKKGYKTAYMHTDFTYELKVTW